MEKTYLAHNIGDIKHANYNSRQEIIDCKYSIGWDGIYKNVYLNKDILVGKNNILFVMGNYVGKDNTFDLHAVPKLEDYCTWEEIKELRDYIILSGGTCELGWHTWSHPDLTTLTKEEIMKEITPPFPMESFAYPYGRYNELVKQCVKEAGYKRAFSVFQTDGDEFSIPRPYLNK